jgi:FKBP-type peptidyl-prolyl cis-trans isomerase 2
MRYPCGTAWTTVTIANGDAVTIEYTGRTEAGTVFDTSRASVAAETGIDEAQPDREYSPLTLEVGSGAVIEGLDEALVGLEAGDTPTVTIPPEKGYGEHEESRVREHDADDFVDMIGGQTPEEGSHIETESGDVAEITHVGSDVVRLDFNHSLAGATLEFDVEVVDVNPD